MQQFDEQYWTKRYENSQTGWDIGYASTPIKDYVNQLTNLSSTILIPGAGNAYEAAYLYNKGFTNTYVVDISSYPLQRFIDRNPQFPQDQLIKADFFTLDGQYDLIIEQTFFCALHPSQRQEYALQMKQLLKPGGKLVGVLFDDPLFDNHPPFGGNRETYLPFFTPHFKINVFERCYNSIPPRQDRELFINLEK
jgi:methyl halide transferase